MGFLVRKQMAICRAPVADSMRTINLTLIEADGVGNGFAAGPICCKPINFLDFKSVSR